MTAAQAENSQNLAIPPLRKCLKIEVIHSEASGLPAAVISDGVSGKYFKLEWPMSGLFLVWDEAGTASEVIARMEERYGVRLDTEDVAQAVSFVFKNELSETDEKGGWQRYKDVAVKGRHSLTKRIMHNYLFFRIPLVHPDRFLARMLPYARIVFTRPFWAVIALIAAVGLYLTTRQWDDLAEAFHDALQFQQIFLYAASLLLLKAFHELGHALTAAHYGCRVPSMGVAFMIGTPMLYTDASDSWRLAERRKRLGIVMAGVAAEAIIAAIALLLWPLLPDGAMRDVCFTFATAAIAMTLAVNLNPFMRFDGYFALSDYMRIPNLQPRAFALAVWQLREFLFGLGDPAPEVFPDRTRRFMIAYAYGTWIYRFFLFLGIALIIYLMAGKALGIVLGLFEIAVFILWPIWGEIRQWWAFRARIRTSRRSAVTAGVACAAVTLFCAPIVRTVESPGVLVAAQEQDLHLPRAAQLKSVDVRPGERVEAGQLLFEAISPELDRKIQGAGLELRLLQLQLRRMVASSLETEQAVVLEREYRAAREKLQGLLREKAALQVKAPFAGQIVDLDTGVSPGTWVAQEAILARLISTDKAQVKALVSDTDLERIAVGATGVFVADEADLASQPVALASIAPASNGHLAESALADLNGGVVGSVHEKEGFRARDGWVEVTLAAHKSSAPARLVRGIVRIESEPMSPMGLVWRQIGKIVVREQGF